MPVVKKIQNFNQLIEKEIGKLNVLQIIGVYIDFGFERIFSLTSKKDYFQYGFYYKRRSDRKNFVNYGRLREFIAVSNDKELAKTFKNKTAFIEKFRDFLGRDVLDMRTASRDDFMAMASRHDKLFIKPIFGKFGIGADLRACGSAEEAEQLFNELSGKDMLVEEVIQQHPDMAGFNDTSLNSMRVVTYLRADGTPCVMSGAVIRLGRKGKIADNFHHNGVGAQVDVETGCVVTKGIDKAGNRYVNHPDSGKQIVGFRVPLWDKVCERVLAAAMVMPEVRYVGWDVAITNDNRVLLVEGNDKADPDLGQMSDDIGKWPVFAQYMNEVKALRNQER